MTVNLSAGLRKMRFPLVCCSLTLLALQVSSEDYTLNYKTDAFDDQYIGCSDELESHMFNVLQEEKSNPDFASAWKIAKEKWDLRNSAKLPHGFKEEHGIALLMFTNQYPQENPIHKQLNNKLGAAGISRDRYMKDFHFKALHFYLSRALQLLKPKCDTKHETYWASAHAYHVAPLLRFGQFTSTNTKGLDAQAFLLNTTFRITTCYGANVKDFSFYNWEDQILIPVAENFKYVQKMGNTYLLESTGQQCSYFNCAYLGGEKQKVATCNTGAQTRDPGNKPQPTKSDELEERMNVLEELISLNHETWNRYDHVARILMTHLEAKSEVAAHMDLLTSKVEKMSMDLNSQMREYGSQVNQNVKETVETTGKLITVIQSHRESLKMLQHKYTTMESEMERRFNTHCNSISGMKANMEKFAEIQINHQKAMEQIQGKLEESINLESEMAKVLRIYPDISILIKDMEKSAEMIKQFQAQRGEDSTSLGKIITGFAVAITSVLAIYRYLY